MSKSDTVIFHAEGTNCVVYCPSEAAGLYIPAQLSNQMGYATPALVIDENTPIFHTLADAWRWHLKFAEQAVAGQHNAIDAQFADVLHILKKKAASLHVAGVLNERNPS